MKQYGLFYQKDFQHIISEQPLPHGCDLPLLCTVSGGGKGPQDAQARGLMRPVALTWDLSADSPVTTHHRLLGEVMRIHTSS